MFYPNPVAVLVAIAAITLIAGIVVYWRAEHRAAKEQAVGLLCFAFMAAVGAFKLQQFEDAQHAALKQLKVINVPMPVQLLTGAIAVTSLIMCAARIRHRQLLPTLGYGVLASAVTYVFAQTMYGFSFVRAWALLANMAWAMACVLTVALIATTAYRQIKRRYEASMLARRADRNNKTPS